MLLACLHSKYVRLSCRYCYGFYSGYNTGTTGVDYHTPEEQPLEEYDLQLWDLVGSDRIGGIAGVFFKRSVGAIMATDIKYRDLETLKKVIGTATKVLPCVYVRMYVVYFFAPPQRCQTVLRNCLIHRMLQLLLLCSRHLSNSIHDILWYPRSRLSLERF
jgi:hypothetical protein